MDDSKKYALYLLLFSILAIVIYIFYRKHFKQIVVGTITLVTGGVKTGKSLLCTYLARIEYKRRYRKWWLATHIFHKKVEKPLFYTNVAFSFGNLKKNKRHKLDNNIRLIELEHLLREKRLNYKSVCYICESSLMADSQDYNNPKRNAELSMFNKLYGHETKGGVLFYDTQSFDDNHYSIKRVVSTFFFIQKSINLWLFRVLYVRELVNTSLATNDFNEDVDLSMRKVIVFFWNYKHYDQYYYSYLTDKLPTRTKKPRFYSGALVSFNPLYILLSLKKKGKKKNEEKKKVN